MCKQCNAKPVYEFSNKRKVCKTCFIRWFEKKVLYTIKKFNMVKKGDVISYKKGKDFRDVVLERVLEFYESKAPVEVVKIPAHLHSQIDKDLLIRKKIVSEVDFINNIQKSQVQRGKFFNKIAISTTTDQVAEEIIKNLIKGNLKSLKLKPVQGKKISLLYLFLDKEVLLYAKLKNLKFNKIKGKKGLLEGLEKKHPEIKHAIVNSYLKIIN